MDPIRFALNKPVTISVAVLLVVMFGLVALTMIPVQLTPNVDKPVVSVTTYWEGALPQEIEREVIEKQEEKLKSVSGLKKMTSTCNKSRGQIVLEFPVGTDKNAALREVSDKLREVEQYPDNVTEPVIEPSDPNGRDYITWMMLKCTDPDFDVRLLQTFMENRIKPILERAPGVTEVMVLGGVEREVQIIVNMQQLAHRRITPDQLIAALRAQNLDVSAGTLKQGKLDVAIRTVGRFNNPNKIEKTIISPPGTPPITVADVAKVELTYKEPFALVRSQGNTVLALNAQRETGSNVIQVMANLKQAIAEANTELLPAEARRLGIKGKLYLDIVYEQPTYINQAIDLVKSNLLFGSALAVIVLLTFLRSLRSTLIVALAIPISVIGTFVAMVAMGRNLNVISLAGLAFATGMVVDNAIVVLENIDRHRQMGEAPMIAAYKGAKEVWGAILASTLTTLAVFIPVLTIQEEAGQLFRDISLAICAAVTLSFIVSITVIPTAAGHWLSKRQKAESRHGRFIEFIRSGFGLAWLGAGVIRMISRLIHYLCSPHPLHTLIKIGIVAAFFIAAIWGTWRLIPSAEYLPSGNQNFVFGFVMGPPGYNIDQKSKIGRQLETYAKPLWQAKLGTTAAAQLPKVPMGPFNLQAPPLKEFFFVAYGEFMFFGMSSADQNNVFPLMFLFFPDRFQAPGVQTFAFQMPLFNTGGQSGNSILLEISGPDLQEVNQVAELLSERFRKDFPQMRPTPMNFDTPGPEVQIRPRNEDAARLGLHNRQVASYAQVFGSGAIIGDYIEGSNTIDLRVIAKNHQRDDAAYMAEMPIATPTGHTVPLQAVADVVRSYGPTEIQRIEELRAVTLEMSLQTDKPLEAEMNRIEQTITDLRNRKLIPPTVRTNLAGSAEKLQQVKEALLGKWTGFNRASLMSLATSRGLWALIVVFLLMVALFENWIYPIIIMISVPLATVGGFLALPLVQMMELFVLGKFPPVGFDVLTMLGFVILVGVVVNNAILIVHQALNLIRGEAEAEVDGKMVTQLNPRDAIAESVHTRIRPIFMSTLTSVGGMLPLVVMPGSGSELYRGLGAVVVGGLLVSTVFTLLLVPLLLSLVIDTQLWIRRNIFKNDSQIV